MSLKAMLFGIRRAAACFKCQPYAFDNLPKNTPGRALLQARYIHVTRSTYDTAVATEAPVKASKPVKSAEPKTTAKPKPGAPQERKQRTKVSPSAAKSTPKAAKTTAILDKAGDTPDDVVDLAGVPAPTIASSPQFIYVAVDGDACQFHQDIIVKGAKGGWQVAERLVAEIKKIFALEKDDLTPVIVQIFVNQSGHMQNGWRQFRIHPKVSAAFFEGLNQADPLLNVVNVGGAKEATDVKVRGGLEFHVKLTECRKVALAGLSDGAYASMLKTFMTRGQREKVVILKTSDDIARNIKFIAAGFTEGSEDTAYSIPLVSLPEELFQARPLRVE